MSDRFSPAQRVSVFNFGCPLRPVLIWLSLVFKKIDHACAQVDLTHLQFVTLVFAAWLSCGEEPVTQPALAEFSRIGAMQLSRVPKALGAKDLLERQRSETDSRKKHVEITAQGTEVLRRALPLAQEAQERYFGDDKGASDGIKTALQEIIVSWGE